MLVDCGVHGKELDDVNVAIGVLISWCNEERIDGEIDAVTSFDVVNFAKSRYNAA